MVNKDNAIVFLALLIVAAIAFIGIIYQNNLSGLAVKSYTPQEGEGQLAVLTTAACSETDNGFDVFVKGTCKKGSRQYTDYCSGGGIVESVCDGNKCILNATACPSGYTCNNGACITVKCLTNNDCNDNNDCTKDICNLPGTDSSYCSNTIITPCSGNGICDPGETCTNQDCEGRQNGCTFGYVCRSGGCIFVGNTSIFSTTTNEYNAPLSGLSETTSVSCKDSDGGIKYYNYGSVNIVDNSNGAIISTYYDYCGIFTKGNNLKEYYCSNNQAYSAFYKCPFGCSGGKCLLESG